MILFNLFSYLSQEYLSESEYIATGFLTHYDVVVQHVSHYTMGTSTGRKMIPRVVSFSLYDLSPTGVYICIYICTKVIRERGTS